MQLWAGVEIGCAGALRPRAGHRDGPGTARPGAGAGAARCLASVRPDNAPGLRLVRRLGFVQAGEQVDGLELVHTLELD
ncbi:MAG: hypothetical protein M3P93_05265 [Actinomycetota bacterium]|nr:hypothetical protein [Actinomycetota bacterium]